MCYTIGNFKGGNTMGKVRKYSLAAFDPKTKKETLIGINVDGPDKFIISDEKSFYGSVCIHSDPVCGILPEKAAG